MSENRFTALPPGYDGPEQGYVCNEFEWLASTIEEGTPVKFRQRRTPPANGPESLGPWRKGTFQYAWFYDGVIATVSEDSPFLYEGEEALITVHCGLGDELKIDSRV